MRPALLCWLGIAGASAAIACSHDYQDFRFVRTSPEVGGDAAAGRSGAGGDTTTPDASAGGGAGGNAATLPDAGTGGGSDAASVSDASAG